MVFCHSSFTSIKSVACRVVQTAQTVGLACWVGVWRIGVVNGLLTGPTDRSCSLMKKHVVYCQSTQPTDGTCGLLTGHVAYAKGMRLTERAHTIQTGYTPYRQGTWITDGAHRLLTGHVV